MSHRAPRTAANDNVVGAYDRIAGLYDRVVAPLEAGTRNRALDVLDPGAGERVLELGCGPGRSLLALAERTRPTGQVLGLDAAPAMLSRAAERVDSSPWTDRIAVVGADARAVPLADASHDIVFVEDTLELFSPGDLRAVLAECRRVLVPDGRLGVVTMERAGLEDDAFVRAYEWAFDHVPGLRRAGCRPIYAIDAIEAAGFQIVHRERERRGGVWPVAIVVGTPE